MPATYVEIIKFASGGLGPTAFVQLGGADAHLKPQLWTQWSINQCVSVVLGIRRANVALASGRERMTSA